MKKIFIFWLLLFFLFIKTIAQNNLPRVIEIKIDTASLQILDSSYQMLEDNTGNLSLQSVSQPPLANNFHQNNAGKLGYSVYAYWFRYRLKNEMDHDAKITIPSLSGYCDLYVSNETLKWKHYQTGYLVPWSRRDGLKVISWISGITLVLKPGEELLLYQRERITPWFLLNPKYISPRDIGFTDKVIQQFYIENHNELIDVNLRFILIGISLLSALLNLFFYRIVREKLYLYFSLFLIFYSSFTFFFTGTGPMVANPDIPFFREYPFLSNALFFISGDLTFFYLIYFVGYYLELFNYYPKWNKLLKAIGFFYLFILIAPFLIPFLSDSWNKLMVLLQRVMDDTIIFLIFITFLLYLRVKNFARLRIIYPLPFLFLWGCLIPLLDIYELILFQFYSIAVPGWVIWIGDWWYLINFGCLGWLVLFFSWDLFQRFRNMQKKIAQQALEKEIERSQLIEQQKIELEKTVDERTSELKQSLHELKSTQAQLIHSEKMASLGELTAGIAHEIQNPLNFVNNFSEVNKELVDELKTELATGNMQQAIEIADDIKDNEEKINHHGKRADAIVKNMLQHSRQTKGIKEPTDINALADEYLRLSYHGTRAKDKNFNAEIRTDFDEAIGKINIVPQDIGKVLLNLYNNAFYAVNEKKKQQTENYNPILSVSTKKIGDRVEIKVSDNGNGIPQNIIDKIFQPFFTTKPPGQGTGLGLSLTYDIITKEHNGTIKVESKEGEGSRFIIYINSTIK